MPSRGEWAHSARAAERVNRLRQVGAVRIWREVTDTRTGEVRQLPADEVSPVGLMMNAIYRRELPAGWVARHLGRWRGRERRSK